MANFMLTKENSSAECSPTKVSFRLRPFPYLCFFAWLFTCSHRLPYSILQEEYKKQLAGNLLKDPQVRILAFKSKPPPPPEGFENPLKLLYSQNTISGAGKPRKIFRHVPQVCCWVSQSPLLFGPSIRRQRLTGRISYMHADCRESS